MKAKEKCCSRVLGHPLCRGVSGRGQARPPAKSIYLVFVFLEVVNSCGPNKVADSPCRLRGLNIYIRGGYSISALGNASLPKE